MQLYAFFGTLFLLKTKCGVSQPFGLYYSRQRPLYRRMPRDIPRDIIPRARGVFIPEHDEEIEESAPAVTKKQGKVKKRQSPRFHKTYKYFDDKFDPKFSSEHAKQPVATPKNKELCPYNWYFNKKGFPVPLDLNNVGITNRFEKLINEDFMPPDFELHPRDNGLGRFPLVIVKDKIFDVAQNDMFGRSRHDLMCTMRINPKTFERKLLVLRIVYLQFLPKGHNFKEFSQMSPHPIVVAGVDPLQDAETKKVFNYWDAVNTNFKKSSRTRKMVGSAAIKGEFKSWCGELPILQAKYEEICILFPVKPEELFPDEVFKIQCRGMVPQGTQLYFKKGPKYFKRLCAERWKSVVDSNLSELEDCQNSHR